MRRDEGSLQIRPVSPRKYVSILYVGFIILIVALLAFSVALVRVRGGHAYSAWFSLFRILYFLQFGLFGGFVLSILLWLLPRSRMPLVGGVLLFGAFHVCVMWLLIWGRIQRSYGIELSIKTVLELFTNPSSIAPMGLGQREFVSFVAIALTLVGVMTVASLFLANRASSQMGRRITLAAFALFLTVHVPVRGYFVCQINRNNHLVLAYNDCVPLPLQSERLIPGLRSARVTLPYGESKKRTEAYLHYISRLEMRPIPQRFNILWINIESLRSDAISEPVMPQLFAYRDKFQIRLNSNHWSGGNATQFGIFSMLSGLSGYQLPRLVDNGVKDPFLVLLSQNGYRLRVAKTRYVHFGELIALPPSGTVLQDIEADSLLESDQRMVDSYLDDRRQREGPAFDFIPFDSTHFPYSFPENAARFTPADLVSSSRHLFLSVRDIEMLRNRYRNACHFVDEKIGRILNDLAASHGFDNTIVIIVGDHGQEFQERGQLTHGSVLNDFQGRTELWMHFPNMDSGLRPIEAPTVHIDIVPTLLQALGFDEDFLYTQGRSLLSPLEHRPLLALCEQGFSTPVYRDLVSDTYISRWLQRENCYLFAGVQRRDGSSVEGDAWLREVQEWYPSAAEMYEILPDVSRPPRKFSVIDKMVGRN